MGGGIVAVRDSRVVAEMPLPIFGVISELPIERIIGNERDLTVAA